MEFFMTDIPISRESNEIEEWTGGKWGQPIKTHLLRVM